MTIKGLSDPAWQEEPLTGFLSRVGLDSGVKEGIQKLGRLWLEVAAEAAVEDSVELPSVEPFSFPLLCPEKGKKQWLVTTPKHNGIYPEGYCPKPR